MGASDVAVGGTYYALSLQADRQRQPHCARQSPLTYWFLFSDLGRSTMPQYNISSTCVLYSRYCLHSHLYNAKYYVTGTAIYIYLSDESICFGTTRQRYCHSSSTLSFFQGLDPGISRPVMQYQRSMGIGSTASWEERTDVWSYFESVAGRAAPLLFRIISDSSPIRLPLSLNIKLYYSGALLITDYISTSYAPFQLSPPRASEQWLHSTRLICRGQFSFKPPELHVHGIRLEWLFAVYKKNLLVRCALSRLTYSYIQCSSRRVSERDWNYQYKTVTSHSRQDGAPGMKYSRGNMQIRVGMKESIWKMVEARWVFYCLR